MLLWLYKHFLSKNFQDLATDIPREDLFDPLLFFVQMLLGDLQIVNQSSLVHDFFALVRIELLGLLNNCFVEDDSRQKSIMRQFVRAQLKVDLHGLLKNLLINVLFAGALLADLRGDGRGGCLTQWLKNDLLEDLKALVVELRLRMHVHVELI